MAATKFLFETSFDTDGRRPSAPKTECAPEPVVEEPTAPPEPTFSAADLAAARAEGEAQGRAAALQDAMASVEHQTTEVLERIALQLEGLLKGLLVVGQEHQDDCLRLSLAILRKLFPHLSATNGLSEIEHVIGEALGRLQEEPRIVIRVADALLDNLQARIDILTQRSGFEGKVVLIADDSMTPDAVRVEWADGGAERDPDTCWDAIEALIDEVVPPLPTPDTKGPQAAATPDQSPEAPQPAMSQQPSLNPEGQPPPPADNLAAQA